MKFDDSNQTIFLNYNPFTKIYDTQYLENATNLFPNKLNNLNGYPLTLLGTNAPPILMIQRKSNGEQGIEGTCYIYLKTLVEKHNFKLNMIFDPEQNRTAWFIESIDQLSNNRINMLPMPVYVLEEDLIHLVLGQAFTNNKLVITAPITLTSNVEFSTDKLIYILCFPLITLMFLLLVYLFDFDQEEWEIFYIFQILMGVSVSQPRKLVERIIFITLVLLSINYSSDLYSNIADIKLSYQESEYNTINDILKSNMTVRTAYSAKIYDDADTKQLFSRSEKILNSDECIQIQIEKRNVFCILAFNRADYFTQRHLNSNGKRLIKMAKPSFRQVPTQYIYEKASPFADRIEKTIHQLVESGIPNLLESRTQIVSLNKDSETSQMTEDILSRHLITILSIGSLLAIIVFFYELLSNGEYLRIIDILLQVF